MEAQTDIQTYLEQGRQALAQGQGREAAIAYAHGAQLEPNNPQVHLGLAEANLALGNYGVVQMACRRVQELQPEGGIEAKISQALLDLLDRRYERALKNVDAVIEEDPSIGYIHALRSQLLRATGQDYDANLARARATRLSYGGRYENSFPPIEPAPAPGYTGAPTPPKPEQSYQEAPERESTPNWSRPNGMQRQVIRTRFALSQYPGLVTNILIAINVVIFLVTLIFQSPGSEPQAANFINQLVQSNPDVAKGEVWRIFTAMFLHAGFYHLAVNMFSLFFIGRAVEIFYGKLRYLGIYLISGIIGGITFFLFAPGEVAVEASGAIFGIFGALGAFYIVNRRALGAYGSGAISNWLFWLILNLALGFFTPGIAIQDHLGGLFAGLILGILFIPRSPRGRTLI